MLLLSRHQPCRAGEPPGPCLELRGPFLQGHVTHRVSSPGPAATACFCQGPLSGQEESSPGDHVEVKGGGQYGQSSGGRGLPESA